MTKKLTTTANFGVLIDAAKRYIATSKPHWPLDQISGKDLIQIGYRLAELKAKGDFKNVLSARNQARRTASAHGVTAGAIIFANYDPARPPRCLMRRSNLRRRPALGCRRFH